MAMPDLKENERIDLTGFGSIRVIQDPGEFCYGVDAVILADFAARRARAIRPESRIMDLGTGSGIIPLILCHKTSAGIIMGTEVRYQRSDSGKDRPQGQFRSGHLQSALHAGKRRNEVGEPGKNDSET